MFNVLYIKKSWENLKKAICSFRNARFRRNFQGNAAWKIALTINSASYLRFLSLSLSQTETLTLTTCIETNTIYIIICKFLELSCLLSACPLKFLVLAVCLNLVSFLIAKNELYCQNQ